jgi:hypothetical protein
MGLMHALDRYRSRPPKAFEPVLLIFYHNERRPECSWNLNIYFWLTWRLAPAKCLVTRGQGLRDRSYLKRQAGTSMVCIVGIIGAVSVLLGGALACAAERVPARVELLEGSGGALLLAGLALIGSGLPFVP